jgi:hypothetical protein
MPELGTRSLRLSVDGTDYSDAVSVVRVDAAESDSDFVSFAAAAAGGARVYTLVLTMVQNTTAASLWRKMWDSAGDEVDVIVRPNGGTTPGASTPTFAGTVIMSEPDGTLLGGEANKSGTARFLTEVSWEFLAKPVLDETA